MLKVQELTVKGYEFSGYIAADDITMNVYGEFTVEFEDGRPDITVCSVCLAGGQELYAGDVDFDDLIEQLYNSGQESKWYSDNEDFYREAYNE
jgi:hypothetical protein